MTSSSFLTAKQLKPAFESLHRSVGLRGELITGFKVTGVRDRELFVSLHETEAELRASSSAGFARGFARLCSRRSSKLGPQPRSRDRRTCRSKAPPRMVHLHQLLHSDWNFKAFEDKNGKHFHESEPPGHTSFEACERSWPTVFSSFSQFSASLVRTRRR